MNIADIDQGVRVKSKRPSDSNFKQQRLPSWQPILTAGTVLPTFFIIGIAFIPVGVLLLYFSNGVSEKVINYTHCPRVENTSQTCAEFLQLKGNENKSCQCSVRFELERDFKGKVYLYYGLTNYYQNHRRYVKSRDDNQLLGEFDSTTSDCAPFQIDGKGNNIVPCGAIANSLFNDTLKLISESHGEVPVNNTGIAWPSDKQIKFRNPPGNLEEALRGKARPIAWKKELWQLDEKNPDNNGLQNEDLIVWMRTAALPSFRKLYRRVNHEGVAFRDGLQRGFYRLEITYNYPVTQFDGSKSFIISTTSILGGKNPFLGWAYITVGSICFVLGIILLIVHLKYKNHAQSTTSNTTQRSPYT